MKVNSNSKASLRVRNSESKEVDRFTYLGANVTKDDGGTADIRKRIAMTSASFRRLDDNIWKALDIGWNTKISLFKSLVLSTFVWMRDLEAHQDRGKEDRSFQTKSLGRIHKVKWQQHVQNKTGLEMTETENINGEEVELDWPRALWIQRITVLWPSGWRLREKKGVAQKQRGDIIEVKRNNAGWSFWNAHALQPQNGTNGGWVNLVQRRTPANNLDLMITKCSLIQQKRSQDNNTNLKTKHRLHVNDINQMQQLHSFHDDKIDLMTTM